MIERIEGDKRNGDPYCALNSNATTAEAEHRNDLIMDLVVSSQLTV
jgi:hypothetical protein